MTIADQQRFWNQWNSQNRLRKALPEISNRQREVVLQWLQDLDRIGDLDIIEIGCGSGWLTPSLAAFGKVTATDLSDEVLKAAETDLPRVTFVPGDFFRLDFGDGRFDVAVQLEILAHVIDQKEFVAKTARLLRPGGHLMLATQNRPVLERYNRVPAPQIGQLRNWLDAAQLRSLLEPHFEVLELFSATPRADRGAMRYLTSPKLDAVVSPLIRKSFRGVLERRGLGWSLMCHARKL